MLHLLFATSGDVTKAGKAIGLALGVGLGALGAGAFLGARRVRRSANAR